MPAACWKARPASSLLDAARGRPVRPRPVARSVRDARGDDAGRMEAGGEGLTMPYGFHRSPFGPRFSSRPAAARRPRLCRRGPGQTKALADMTPALAGRRLPWRTPPAPHALAQRIFEPNAVAARRAAARRADRHRFRGAGVGDAAARADGPRHHLFRRRSAPAPPRRRARSAPRSARTRSPSWSRAIACSARAATSPAITGASPASARSSVGKRVRQRR